MKYIIGILFLIISGALNTYIIYANKINWKSKYSRMMVLVLVDIAVLVIALTMLTSK